MAGNMRNQISQSMIRNRGMFNQRYSKLYFSSPTIVIMPGPDEGSNSKSVLLCGYQAVCEAKGEVDSDPGGSDTRTVTPGEYQRIADIISEPLDLSPQSSVQQRPSCSPAAPEAEKEGEYCGPTGEMITCHCCKTCLAVPCSVEPHKFNFPQLEDRDIFFLEMGNLIRRTLGAVRIKEDDFGDLTHGCFIKV